MIIRWKRRRRQVAHHVDSAPPYNPRHAAGSLPRRQAGLHFRAGGPPWTEALPVLRQEI